MSEQIGVLREDGGMIHPCQTGSDCECGSTCSSVDQGVIARRIAYAFGRKKVREAGSINEQRIADDLVAAETFKCPNCDTKVLKQTEYCVTCKKKVKASGRRARSET